MATSKRKSISKKMRFEVFKRDQFTCQYCGQAAPDVILHVDHIKPIAEGGETDIINLITSCVDCNLGKGAKVLSDSSAVKKQKRQLDELQTRREQIEMIGQWRESLAGERDRIVAILEREINRVLVPYSVSDAGMVKIKSASKKYSLNILMESIDVCYEQYARHDEGALTKESAAKIIKMIPHIARHINDGIDPKIGAQAAYLVGIVKNRLPWAKAADIATCFGEFVLVLHDGMDYWQLAQRIGRINNWNDYSEAINQD